MAALNGSAALIYNPLDQGERIQRLEKDSKVGEWGVQAHNRLGALAVLVGWNTATFRYLRAPMPVLVCAADAALIVDGRGKAAAVDRARTLARRGGRAAAAADLRGFGEPQGARRFYGSEHRDETDCRSVL